MAQEHGKGRTNTRGGRNKKKATGEKNEPPKLDWQADVIAFALFELKCPNLDYVYDMSYAEFQIRAFAYNRVALRKFKLYRKQLYTQLIAPYQDYKKIPKTEERFMPLFGDPKTLEISQDVKDRYMAKMAEYNRKKNERGVTTGD